MHTIGHDGDAGNHQYDIEDFYDAVKAGNFPTVSFLKASRYQDGHASNSDPLDEQAFIVHVINFLQSRPEWCDTAVVIAYDDSDGWYDHQMGPIVNHSTSADDALTSPLDPATGVGQCGTDGPTTALPGPDGVAHAQGRCGYGPRLPLLVISPWAKKNFVDHTVTDQTLDHPLHRGLLAPRPADRRRLVRRDRQLDRRHVRLRRRRSALVLRSQEPLRRVRLPVPGRKHRSAVRFSGRR